MAKRLVRGEGRFQNEERPRGLSIGERLKFRDLKNAKAAPRLRERMRAMEEDLKGGKKMSRGARGA